MEAKLNMESKVDITQLYLNSAKLNSFSFSNCVLDQWSAKENKNKNQLNNIKLKQCQLDNETQNILENKTNKQVSINV